MKRALPVLLTLWVLGGCQTPGETRKANLLDSTVTGYGAALRWGHYESALSVRDPELGESPLPDVKNLRLTGYEVVSPPVMIDEVTAVQVVRIEYVREDEQRVHSLMDQQRWRYDPELKAWWLASPFPEFR